MRIDAIIFDFDGVIADSEVVANTILAEEISGLGFPTTYEEALGSYCGRQWSDCITIIEDKIGRPVPGDFLPNFYQKARARHIETMVPVAGVGAFIRNHAHRGMAVASSNDRDWLLGCLKRMSLAGWFGAHVYSGADMARGKPHPDIFLHAAGSIDADPQNTIVIEDSPIGVTAGKAAGMTVIGLLAGGHIRDGHGDLLRDAGAAHVVADYRALHDLIAKLES